MNPPRHIEDRGMTRTTPTTCRVRHHHDGRHAYLVHHDDGPHTLANGLTENGFRLHTHSLDTVHHHKGTIGHTKRGGNLSDGMGREQKIG